jgi:outer membrane protein
MKQLKKHIFLLTIFAFAFLQSGVGQNVWALEDCIIYAFENNIVIKQQKIATEYNQNTLKQSKIGRLPNLNAGANQGLSFGHSLDLTTYEFVDNQVSSTGVNLGSTVTLFNGLQKMNTIQQNEFNLMASLQDLEKLKNDIALGIATYYLQILFNRELLEIARNQHEITLQQVERTAKLVDAGSLARGSLLEIQAIAASEELNVITAENRLSLSYLDLTQTLDLDSVGDFEIIIPEFEDFVKDPIIVTVGSVYNDAINVMPQIKGAEFELKSAYESLSIAQGARVPSLTFNANWNTGYSDVVTNPVDPTGSYPFWDQMGDNSRTGLTLGLNIPIFNGWMTNTNVSNAKLNVNNYMLQLETTKNNLYKAIQQGHADAVAARKKYLATEEALVSMEESFKYTEEKFEVGLVNTVDYNTEKNRLTATQSDLLQSKYDFIFKMKILDFYRGIPIRL